MEMTCRDSALCEISRALAAPVKLPCLATASKARKALSGSQRRSIRTRFITFSSPAKPETGGRPCANAFSRCPDANSRLGLDSLIWNALIKVSRRRADALLHPVPAGGGPRAMANQASLLQAVACESRASRQRQIYFCSRVD